MMVLTKSLTLCLLLARKLIQLKSTRKMHRLLVTTLLTGILKPLKLVIWKPYKSYMMKPLISLVRLLTLKNWLKKTLLMLMNCKHSMINISVQLRSLLWVSKQHMNNASNTLNMRKCIKTLEYKLRLKLVQKQHAKPF